MDLLKFVIKAWLAGWLAASSVEVSASEPEKPTASWLQSFSLALVSAISNWVVADRCQAHKSNVPTIDHRQADRHID